MESDNNCNPFKKRKAFELKHPDITQDPCPICFDKLIPNSTSIIDCCTHKFCTTCIIEWSKISNSCPVCNRALAVVSDFKNRRHKQYIAQEVDNRVDFYSDPFYDIQDECNNDSELTDYECVSEGEYEYDEDYDSDGSWNSGGEFYSILYIGDPGEAVTKSNELMEREMRKVFGGTGSIREPIDLSSPKRLTNASPHVVKREIIDLTL